MPLRSLAQCQGVIQSNGAAHRHRVCRLAAKTSGDAWVESNSGFGAGREMGRGSLDHWATKSRAENEKKKKNRTEKDDPPGPHLQRLMWLLQSKNTPNSGLLQGFLGGHLSTSSHILQVPSGLVRAATDRLHRQSRPLSDQHLPPCPGSDQFSGSSLQFLSSPASARQKKKKEERVKTPKQLLLVSHDRHAALIPSLSFYFIFLF